MTTPDSLRRWFRQWAARKYDSSGARRPGRSRKPPMIRELVVRLAREAGRRDARYAQTFEELPASLRVSTGDDAPAARGLAEYAAAPASAGPTLAARVATLEAQVAELRAELAALKGEKA